MKKWLLRILILVAVLIALALFGLKIVSGTSDSHKQGLEQAFSQIFKGQASFGALKQFNLIPQFAIEVENLQILGINNSGNLVADQFLIAFGPIDLLRKSRLIETFDVKNLTVTEGLYTPLALHLSEMGIRPNDNGDAARLGFKGTYGGHDINGEFAMAKTDDVRPKYFFNDQNAFQMNLGLVEINGLFLPYAAGGAKVSHLELKAPLKDKSVECGISGEEGMEFSAFIKDVIGKVATVKTSQDFMKLCGTF